MTRSRGRPTIREISYVKPTSEEKSQLPDAAVKGEPIVTAILGAAMIELELETLLRQRFSRITDSTWATMVRENGPFSTFDQKITAAFAFRIFDEVTKENLKIVKNIRNAFAHAKKLIDFDHELVAAELEKIQVPNFRKVFHRELQKKPAPPKIKYVLLCMVISTHLSRKYGTALSAKTKRLNRKVAKYNAVSPLAQALISSVDLRNKSTGSIPLSSLPSQIGGPSPQAPQGYIGGLLALIGEQKDKSNK
jgi:hypothetical protein